MDGRAAINLNHVALRRILGDLIAMAGLGATWRNSHEASGGGDPANTLSRHLYLAVLRLLRPAEAAARRLIVALACGLAVPDYQPGPRKPKPRSSFARGRAGTGILPPGPSATPARPSVPLAFRLLDPMRRPFRLRRPAARGVPRITMPGVTKLFPVVVRPRPSPGDPVDTIRLARRFAALASALDDLPRQAWRLARWRARNDYLRRNGRYGRAGPLRPGRPPGGRLSVYDPLGPARSNVREVDRVLIHCHALARFALERPDTS